MPLIESYNFGKIIIDGKTYTSDLILYPDKVDDHWWRISGHLLQKEDLKDVIQNKPDVLIVGTGAEGLMEVPRETKKFLELNGINLIVKKTSKASEIYNNLKDKQKVIAALHLTC